MVTTLKPPPLPGVKVGPATLPPETPVVGLVDGDALAELRSDVAEIDEGLETVETDVDLLTRRVVALESVGPVTPGSLMAIRSTAIDQALRLTDFRVASGVVEKGVGLQLSTVLHHADVIVRYITTGEQPPAPSAPTLAGPGGPPQGGGSK